MKRILAALLLALLFSAACPIMAEGDGEGDGEISSQNDSQGLTSWERALIKKRDAVLAIAIGFVDDGRVTDEEMLLLRSIIKDFDRTAAATYRYSNLQRKYLIVLPRELVEAVDSYWNSTERLGYGRESKMRAYLTQLVGHEVAVQAEMLNISPGQIFLIIVFLISTALCFFFLVMAGEEKEVKFYCIAILFGFIAATILYMLFVFYLR